MNARVFIDIGVLSEFIVRIREVPLVFKVWFFCRIVLKSDIVSLVVWGRLCRTAVASEKGDRREYSIDENSFFIVVSFFL